MMKESEGTELMKKIASFVREGAMSYLKQQYKVVASVFVVLVILFSIMAYGFRIAKRMGPDRLPDRRFLFRISGFLRHEDSDLCLGPYGERSPHFLEQRLTSRFSKRGGHGLSRCRTWIAGYLILVYPVKCFHPDEALDPTHKLTIITTTMLTFGMGASTKPCSHVWEEESYTKAADVGADLVGKVEAGIGG